MQKRGNENKPHIGIYGACNSGKSTFLNALSSRSSSIVSSVAGTTTDPVKVSIEFLDFAPVIAIDTAGIDDTSEIGILRVRKSYQTLQWIDIAVVVFSKNRWDTHYDTLLEKIKEEGIPYIIIYNTFDTDTLSASLKTDIENRFSTKILEFSPNISTTYIADKIKKTIPEYSYTIPTLFSDNVKAKDHVLLVCPIDSEAPSGRLILPQVQAIRSILDIGATTTVLQPESINSYIQKNIKTDFVVTDSTVYSYVRSIIPPNIPVSTFSIELAKIKGDMPTYNIGLSHIDNLSDGDKILILESCSHQVSCEDIGRVKIPMLLSRYSGKKLEFSFISGLESLPDNISDYSLAIQCGGCMVTRRQLFVRLRKIKQSGVKVVNYGMLLSKITTNTSQNTL